MYEEYIRKWFRDLKTYSSETDNENILLDPSRILNGDETSFKLCPQTGKVIGPKGWKNIYDIKRGNEKKNNYRFTGFYQHPVRLLQQRSYFHILENHRRKL